MKCAIIGGGGMVGAAAAYAIVSRDIPVEIILVDVIAKAAVGQAQDIDDASIDSHASCQAGQYSDCGDCDLIIISAGYPQKPGETRAMLLHKNKEILQEVFKSMGKLKPDCKVLIVANPVDVLTYVAQKISGLPKNQVFGSGTWLDSLRLRNAISNCLDVRPTNIQAYVLGEHGDRQVVAWSKSTYAGVPILDLPEFKDKDPNEIVKDVSQKAYAIIDAKRSTYFGIGKCISDFVLSMSSCRDDVYPLSVYHPTKGVYLSWPAILNEDGIRKVLEFTLTPEEEAQLDIAVAAIKEMCEEADRV